ncbi:hypothetical protein Rleg9DRAFT_0617 [Rhizobium leguminosarum bv. trifolii WSM597]|uniref:Uncharacterized protein n=1 Tax=Rhizobium leguminosarum bv. trifolii WSM597 TaxID=754764 RepID=J0GWG6_RHILT|nr:hypothetical protein Rleg9DRAFT_0617 [Rhizobium leguminosarum bv. trifolii WSM597]
MARPFSNDLRERVVGAVTQEGLSCRAAAKRRAQRAGGVKVPQRLSFWA